MNKALSEPTITERAVQMTAEARSALKQVLTDKFNEFRKLAETSRFAAVRGVNVARDIGRQIELFTGHEKLLTSDFNLFAPAIPDASLDFAKSCLALHHKFNEPVMEYSEAAPEWDRLLVQLELLPAGRRKLSEGKSVSEPIKDQLARVSRVAHDSVAFEKDHPITQWPEFFITTFLRESEPLDQLRKKAMQRLAEIGNKQ